MTTYTVIDSDTHITEPPDTWTARVPERFRDRVPYMTRDADGRDIWMFEGQHIYTVGFTAAAGWPDPFPDGPATLDQCHPASYDAHARLRYMDEVGIWAQVLYPNVAGFGHQKWIKVPDEELKLLCVHAYNDFLRDWASADARRLVTIMAVPYWDIDATVAEIERGAAAGHQGVLFTGKPQNMGLPYLGDRHWDPMWAAAADHGLPVHFHIGSGDFGGSYTPERVAAMGSAATYAYTSVEMFMGNGIQVADLLLSGVLPRFPSLRCVSVESGIGWIPFVLEACDYSILEASPGRRKLWDRMPSDYFREQVYTCYWFEEHAPRHMVGEGAIPVDRILFETDFPHPTCLYGNIAERIEAGLGGQPEDVRRKILWDNAADLYRITGPERVSDDLDGFRARVRAWLEAHGREFVAPPEGDGEAESVARQKAMQASLFDHGLAGLTVPTALGGQGLGVREQFAFNEEIAGYGLENGHLVIGLGMVVPTLIAHGTPEQQQRYLPRLLRGDDKWCQFFSEPGAGSDLASLSTRAVRDGDEWVVTGQKVWTSGARHAAYGVLLARTDLDAPKHEGITMFVCPLGIPGITIRPLRQITGSSGFNEVFFDEARIPREHVLGPVNGGWRVGVTTLMNERATLGAGRAGSGAAVASRLIETARAAGLADDPSVRDALADFWIRETIVSYLGQRLRAAVLAGRQPGPEGSLAKLAHGFLAWRAGELGIRFGGLATLAWPGAAPDVAGQPPHGWARALLQAPSQTIAGGTTEVQKGIIGERLLGLPKEPVVDKGIPFRQLLTSGTVPAR